MSLDFRRGGGHSFDSDFFCGNIEFFGSYGFFLEYCTLKCRMQIITLGGVYRCTMRGGNNIIQENKNELF